MTRKQDDRVDSLENITLSALKEVNSLKSAITEIRKGDSEVEDVLEAIEQEQDRLFGLFVGIQAAVHVSLAGSMRGDPKNNDAAITVLESAIKAVEEKPEENNPVVAESCAASMRSTIEFLEKSKRKLKP